MTDRAVLVDIDGTLALRTGDRSPYDWDRVGVDDPKPPVIELEADLGECSIHPGPVQVGRSNTCRSCG
jgi:hypothetical protein